MNSFKSRLDRLEDKLQGKVRTVELEDGSEISVRPEKALEGFVASLEGIDLEEVDPEVRKLAEVKEGQGKFLDTVKETLNEGCTRVRGDKDE